MSKLKEYLHSNIVTQGYGLEYAEFTEYNLDNIIELAQQEKVNLSKGNLPKVKELYEGLVFIEESVYISDEGKEESYKSIRKDILLLTGTSFWSNGLQDFILEVKEYIDNKS